MKKMNLSTMVLLLVLAGWAFQGCDDDDNIRVDPAVEEAFLVRYPEAVRVEWESKYGFYVADFWHQGKETEVWYSRSADWMMTETDVVYADLPEAVKEAFSSGDYKDWRVDDIDMLERKDLEVVYVIEVEKDRAEYDLYYAAEGALIKAVPDNGNVPGEYLPGELSATIRTFIEEKFPGAGICDIDIEHGQVEVDIMDGKTPREMLFKTSGEWIHTQTELRRLSDLPEIVSKAFNESEYASWHVDDIDFYQTPTGDYYLLEVESGNREVHLKITPEGVVE